MKSVYRTSQPFRSSSRPTSAAARPVQQPALGDERFRALLAQANAFFGNAERDVVAEKAAVIAEIRALMAEYQLDVDDLRD